MKISIVIPSFQQVAFLPATLASVLGQDHADREIIVNDGGSTDGSVQILERASVAHGFSWESRKDGGQAEAINRGLNKATGDIFAFLNSDDIYYSGALRRVVAHFAAHPESEILYGNGNHLHADGGVSIRYPTEEWNFERLQSECFICQPATFWRRSFFQRFGPFDESLRYALDYEYWLRAGRAVAFSYLQGEPLAGSRIHAATKTFGERLPAHIEYLRVVLRHGGTRAAVLKWLRAVAELRAALPAPPSTRRTLALRYSWHLLRGSWEFGVPWGSDLFAEAKAALVARKYSHMRRS